MSVESGARGRWRRSAASLQIRNFRIYLYGTVVSQAGSWLQLTAELWAIVELTHSGTAVGLHSVLRFGPIVLFGLYGGLLGDRVDRRKLLFLTQLTLAAAAAAIAVAWGLGYRSLVIIYAVVLVQGLVNAVDNPLRRTFIRDMVDDPRLANALGLEGAISTVSRTIGPAVAGVVITTLGVGWCFTLNAVSFVAVLASVALIDRRKLRRAVPVPRARGQIRDGLRYAWGSPAIRQTLLLAAIVGAFGWNWQTLLPLFSADTLHGDAAQFGLLVSMLSVGALVGAVVVSRMERPSRRYLLVACAVLAAALMATAAAPNLAVAIATVIVIGLAGTIVNISSQTRLQLLVSDDMTGRLMALYSMAWLGTRPVGGAIGGWLTDWVGPRGAFLAGGLVIAGATVLFALHRYRRPGPVEEAPHDV
ncbi:MULTISPECIES: MFS transporter [unclassified Mycobacterium]|uniref:MFS transporter n=1 Tax=unclassified Mycobacterium TaxID=2642494 RepID=UPI0029C8DA2F|nr:MULTISPECIES: MFS transporter [unclassified Mycobacterium]